MSDTDGVPIVPFGKFKGQPVTEMLKDRGYSDWFRLQAGMADRYPVIFNFVVGTTKPTKGKRKKQDTPEHNAMQARWLGEGLRAVLVRRYIPSEHYYRGPAGDMANDDRRYTLTITPPTFEGNGWDVEFDAYVDFEHPESRRRNYWSRADHHDYRVFYIELKPSISDDYPVVLRQVMDRRTRQNPRGFSTTNCCFIVITNELAPSSVTADEVRAIFKSQHIDVLLTSELEQGQVAA